MGDAKVNGKDYRWVKRHCFKKIVGPADGKTRHGLGQPNIFFFKKAPLPLVSLPEDGKVVDDNDCRPAVRPKKPQKDSQKEPEFVPFHASWRAFQLLCRNIRSTAAHPQEEEEEHTRPQNIPQITQVKNGGTFWYQ
jgi:hypothetical protein